MFQIQKFFKRWERDEAGATAVIYAICAPVLIGFLSLAVEIGHYQQRNARIQSTADMAAMAAALEYQLTFSRQSAIMAGKGDAYENGYIENGGTIVVQSPIASGPHAGKEGAYVRIKQRQESYFSKIFKGNSEVTHSVEATVLLSGGQPVCMLALHPTTVGAVTVSGSANLEMEGCAMHSNSSAVASFNMGGAGTIAADCISATGTVSGAETATLHSCPEPQDYRPTVRDPYADISVPSNVASMPCLTPAYANRGIQIGPGRYCGDFGLGGLLELTAKGVYIFDDASIFFKSKGSMKGPPEGVTMIFMNGSIIENTNGGAMEVYAQPDGPYAGVLMYSDRDTSDPNDIIRLNGNQGARFEGALYFPTQKLDFRGGADLASDCTQIVASEIEFSGNSALTNRDCGPRGTRSINQAGKGVRLVH